MISQAKFKHVRVSPRKVLGVVDMVRGKNVQQALDVLAYDRRKVSKDVRKLILSALANASQKPGVNVNALFIKKIVVDKGAVMKRFMPRARGSASQILKRMSHLTVELDQRI